VKLAVDVSVVVSGRVTDVHSLTHDDVHSPMTLLSAPALIDHPSRPVYCCMIVLCCGHVFADSIVMTYGG